MSDPVSLALFDLDNTLIAGDSDYLWGRYLVAQGLVDAERYERDNQRFYQAYQAGQLDMDAFLRFVLAPLAQYELAELKRVRRTFIEEWIVPLILPAGRELVGRHRAAGDVLAIVTATNRFVTEPIAEALGVANLLATEAETADGRYTGSPKGIPCFQEGKVKRLDQWLRAHHYQVQESWFYSDSHNDLPLLERVDHPVAVDPDPVLAKQAERKGWPIITLRS